jgi:hypothetical protein
LKNIVIFKISYVDIGTEFMHRLSAFIWFYVLEKMNSNSAWRDVKVIFSDASVPVRNLSGITIKHHSTKIIVIKQGEGEHKIMSFIRNERSQPDYDPNQKHILHGLDADLIMLALATHESHFSILREQVIFGRRDNAASSTSDAQKLLDAGGAAISALRPQDEWVFSKRLQVARIYVLREYLANEFKVLETSLPFPFDFERVVDDFVFICFFVGNDFLPHLPSMDIRDGALDFLVECYKEMLPSLGDYLTAPGGNVNLRQVDVILSRVGEIEDEIFRRRKGAEEAEEARRGGGGNQICRQFRSTGSCVRGAACKFSHDAPLSATDTPALVGGKSIVPNTSRATGTSALTDVSGFKPSFELVSSIHAARVKNEKDGKVTEEANTSAAMQLKEKILRKRKSQDISDTNLGESVGIAFYVYVSYFILSLKSG